MAKKIFWVALVIGIAFVIHSFNMGGSHSTAKFASSKLLNNIRVVPVPSEKEVGQPIQASDLWKDNGAVVLLVRRPGCALCREDAVQLNRLKPALDQMNVQYVAVTHERKGIDEFKPFFNGPVYLDEEKTFFKEVLGNRWSSLAGTLRPSVLSHYRDITKRGIKGNFEGEGRLMGGLLVLSPKPYVPEGSQDKEETNIVFEHREETFGDHSDPAKVLAAVKQMMKSLHPEQDFSAFDLAPEVKDFSSQGMCTDTCKT